MHVYAWSVHNWARRFFSLFVGSQLDPFWSRKQAFWKHIFEIRNDLIRNSIGKWCSERKTFPIREHNGPLELAEEKPIRPLGRRIFSFSEIRFLESFKAKLCSGFPTVAQGFLGHPCFPCFTILKSQVWWCRKKKSPPSWFSQWPPQAQACVRADRIHLHLLFLWSFPYSRATRLAK